LEPIAGDQKRWVDVKAMLGCCCMNSGAIKKQLESFDDGELVRTEAIIQS
jgi:hypothetical protein